MNDVVDDKDTSILNQDTDKESSDDVVDTSDNDNIDEGSAPSDNVDAVAESDNDDDNTYADFTLPEGIELDQVALDSYTPLLKELGLNQEQAQKLVDLRANEIKASLDNQNDTFTQLIDGWKNDSINDKEFGGDNFNENVGIAQQAIEKFGNSEFKKLIDDHGVGNHPEMIRFMLKVGKLTMEDNPGSLGVKTTTEQDAVSILYPNS